MPNSQANPTEKNVKTQVTKNEWSRASPIGASKSTAML